MVAISSLHGERHSVRAISMHPVKMGALVRFGVGPKAVPRVANVSQAAGCALLLTTNNCRRGPSLSRGSAAALVESEASRGAAAGSENRPAF